MIHVSKISLLAEQMENGQPKLFSCKFVKRTTGEIVTVEKCFCTSVHSEGGTMNIKFPNGQIRKIRILSIIEFNGVEVYV